MPAHPLLRVLGVPADIERGLSRLEKSVLELKEDVDVALQAFVAKNQRTKELLRLPDSAPMEADESRALSQGIHAFEPASTSADWPQWERHPNDDAVLVLLAGRVTVLLEVPGGEERVVLEEGRACVVPRGTWHRAIAELPGKLLAITSARTTERRAL